MKSFSDLPMVHQVLDELFFEHQRAEQEKLRLFQRLKLPATKEAIAAGYGRSLRISKDRS
jgi:hypothetical protein